MAPRGHAVVRGAATRVLRVYGSRGVAARALDNDW
jgi:hypothetical protein